MSDWESACDPVQRRELTEAEKHRLAALMELRRRQRASGLQARFDSTPSFVNPDFDDMGA